MTNSWVLSKFPTAQSHRTAQHVPKWQIMCDLLDGWGMSSQIIIRKVVSNFDNLCVILIGNYSSS
jgi:hypothetical protein